MEENKNQYRIESDAVEKVKNILRDVIYVKKYIRNAMNYASDENNTSDEYNEYFHSQGYVVDKELNVNEIKEYLTNAINKLY